jgi:hypothetical protein
MSVDASPKPPADGAAAVAAQLPPPSEARLDGVSPGNLMDEATENRLDRIEMIGEEASLPAHIVSEVPAGVRYLHSSRTIHELVTDRNRCVGIYLGVASLLVTACAALLNAKPAGELPVPIEVLQYGCLPATFGILTVLALFIGLLLVRTRVGLIYEVAKMNVLLGIPFGRVQRVNPLSLFFLMHLLVSSAGGLSAGLFTWLLMRNGTYSTVSGVLVGAGVTTLLVFLYVAMVSATTQDEKLQAAGR